MNGSMLLLLIALQVQVTKWPLDKLADDFIIHGPVKMADGVGWEAVSYLGALR
jgi:hypothetical protein